MATWKPIQDFPNYEVSDEGQIRSLPRRVPRRTKGDVLIHPAYLLPAPDRDGYMKVRLTKDGRRHKKTVHRLVADAFIPNRYGKPQINHIDGDKANNGASNLEWSTCRENHSHRRHVLLKNIGEGNGNAKLSKEVVREIRASDKSHADLAREHGTSPQAIGYARRRQTWRHV